METREQQFLAALKHEVVPALGCTEPIAVALACAVGASLLKHEAVRNKHFEPLSGLLASIEVKVSPNLYKNAVGVAVPGTGKIGLEIAAGVGALGGNPQGGLEVLASISPETVKEAEQLISAQKITVGVVDTDQPLLVQVCLTATCGVVVDIEIQGEHQNFTRKDVRRTMDDTLQVVTEWSAPWLEQGTKPYSLSGCTLRDIFEWVDEVDLGEIDFMSSAITMNADLTTEGLHSGPYGLQIGRTLEEAQKAGYTGYSLTDAIVSHTAAASDARMGGAKKPAMTNSGSGNQGIVATMPVVMAGVVEGHSDEALLRAVTLSHLTAIYIHNQLPALSALCAATTAAMGAAMGISYLIAHNTNPFDTGAKAIVNMVADLSGLICDGAGTGCSLKVATSSNSAIRAVLLAMGNHSVPDAEGLIESSVERSISNLCKLACGSMRYTDTQIVDIMSHKDKVC